MGKRIAIFHASCRLCALLALCSCSPGKGADFKNAWKEKFLSPASAPKTSDAPPESRLSVGEVYRDADGTTSMAVKKYRSLAGDACAKLRLEQNGRIRYRLLCERDGAWRFYPAFGGEDAQDAQ